MYNFNNQINICDLYPILVYVASIYIIASIYYLIVTKKFGTPFADALEKYPELKRIKEKSANERGNAFYQGLFLACVIMFIIQPFNKC